MMSHGRQGVLASEHASPVVPSEFATRTERIGITMAKEDESHLPSPSRSEGRSENRALQSHMRQAQSDPHEFIKYLRQNGEELLNHAQSLLRKPRASLEEKREDTALGIYVHM